MHPLNRSLPPGAQFVGALSNEDQPTRRMTAALRLWRGGDADRCLALGRLSDGLPCDAASRAEAALVDLMWAVEIGAARPLLGHRPCCPCIGRDEARLCAAAHNAAQGGDGLHRARGLLAGVLRPEAVPAALAAAARLGAALRGTPAPAEAVARPH